ncbi:hypothetical protein G3O08_08635 [Cryomorpha ignava]|uniref:Uncharacterized protein n=2 Tax=Cryomorpha ignava TaxID=101383 RepID=A0A7K3WSE0_9FLAO|nr:hypothetical protein [Cryomorpha ignava]
MLIRTAQIEALGTPKKEKFIEKTIAFLKENTPKWAESKTDDQISATIENMIELGRERNIKKEINIQKLLFHWIKYELKTPPSPEIDAELIQESRSENYRVKCMIKAIRRNGVR